MLYGMIRLLSGWRILIGHETMKEITKKALEYLEKYNFSVIPVRSNKLPYIQWLPYQKERPQKSRVIDWFERKFPKAMIGIVTGEISNLTVIDIDTTEGFYNIKQILPAGFKAPCVSTPKGGRHLYCQYKVGVRNNARAIPGTDLRSEGGYVAAPPSININRKKYEWVKGYTLEDIQRPVLPDEYIQVIAGGKARFTEAQLEKGAFEEGRRDDDLFHVAHCLVKGQMGLAEMKLVLRKLAAGCNPPFSEKEADIKAESAFNRFTKFETSLRPDVRDLISSYSGVFHIKEVYSDLGFAGADMKNERKHINVYIGQFVKEGLIERHGKRNGVYRVVDKAVEKMVLGGKRYNTVDLKFPMDLHEMVTIYPGNVIVIAGSINVGKTGWLLNFIKLNMDKHEIHYFNSESGEEEFENRLLLFKGMSLDDWKFTAWQRGSNFADLIKPDVINVIDYMEIYDQFWKIGAMIKEVHDKLNKGIAVIALQKSKGQYMGRGMEFSGEKPRLYLAMDSGRMTIVKAKNWKTDVNPNGMIHDFKLVQGSEFIPMGFWRRGEKE